MSSVIEFLNACTKNPFGCMTFLKDIHPTIYPSDEVQFTPYLEVRYPINLAHNVANWLGNPFPSHPARFDYQEGVVKLQTFREGSSGIEITCGYAPEIGVLYVLDREERARMMNPIRVENSYVDPNDIPEKWIIGDDGEIIEVKD